jgi:subfamily B ATP-binding cassette protein MsbA
MKPNKTKLDIESGEPLNGKQLYARLLGYVKPYWKRLAASMGLLALLAATEPLFPILMKPLLDEGFTNQNEFFIRWIPIALVGLFLLRGALTFSSSYASAWVANRVVADIREELFTHLLYLPASFYDKNSSARLSSHIAYDVNNVTGAATNALTVLTRDSLTIVGLMSWLLWLDWKLTSITIALFPLIALTIRYFNRRLRKISSESQYAMAGITHTIEEAAANNRIVKIFSAQDFEKEQFKKQNEHNRRLGVRSTVASTAVSPLVQLITSLSVAIIIGIALNSDSPGTASAGGFVSFLTALMMLLPPIKRLTDIMSVIQRGMAAAELIFSILDAPTERKESTASEKPLSKMLLSEDIHLEAVSFRYPEADTNALSSLSLSIPKNQKTALVGRSGSGKSTLIQLLSGFYCVTQGDIRFGETSIRDIPLKQLRQNIAYVSQEVRLFNNSVLYNVAYGDPNPDSERAQESLRAAHAWEFIEKLPEQMNAQIGQNGVKLSGGQKQRLAIARAFYKNAPILILDEATSALDTESEQKIQDGLERLSEGRTTIAIAHRLSTIEKSDVIHVIEHGAVIETGTHLDLINKNGVYAHLHALQASGSDIL